MLSCHTVSLYDGVEDSSILARRRTAITYSVPVLAKWTRELPSLWRVYNNCWRWPQVTHFQFVLIPEKCFIFDKPTLNSASQQDKLVNTNHTVTQRY